MLSYEITQRCTGDVLDEKEIGREMYVVPLCFEEDQSEVSYQAYAIKDCQPSVQSRYTFDLMYEKYTSDMI